MIIGVPKEIKTREYRVGINPGGVLALTAAGHEVHVQKGAGIGSGISDEQLKDAGAKIVPGAADAWAADLVMKVKEPIAEEYQYFREGQILYTYLHLAPLPELTKELMQKKVRAIAYETIQLPNGSLPLLTPMSEVAGRLSVQVGAQCLEKHEGGKGLLLGGVPGTRRGRIAILGGGIVGSNAAQIAVGMGAHVIVLDIDHDRMAHLEDVFQGEIETLYSNPATIAEVCAWADMVVGAVLVAGARTPTLVTREHLKGMSDGFGRGRRGRRSGGLHRDLPSHDPRRSHLRRRGRGALLRRQHARRGAPHQHLRADQRHPEVRGGDRQPRRRRGREGRFGPGPGRQHLGRRLHLRGRGYRRGHRLRAPRDGARLSARCTVSSPSWRRSVTSSTVGIS